MAVLSWGKCKLEHAASVDGAPSGDWTELDTPKLDTTVLTPTSGDEVLAQEEGGDIVDARYGRTTYELEFDIFVKKGKDHPFDDDDGRIAGEFAFRVTPEDEECEGIQIDRGVLRCEENYTTADGKTLHYVLKCLKPAEGQTVKPYFAGGGSDDEKKVGDICFYDSQKAKLVIVDFDKWSTDPSAYPDTRYTPIGVVVIPASHDVYGTGECAVMSLKYMDTSTPDEGSASGGTMYWGEYDTDTDLPNLNVTAITGTCDAPGTEITGEQSSNCRLPGDSYSAVACPTDPEAFYYASSSSYYAAPSPYLEDGSRNPAYYQTESPTSESNCLADFGGADNTNYLIGLATGQTDWKTAETIDNQSGAGYSPAACCCWRYHTDGTSQGDWYLPACGEMGYFVVRRSKLNATITALMGEYGSEIGLTAGGGYFWSSSEYSSTRARDMHTSYGTVRYNYKHYSSYVRAFLRV